MQPRCVINIFTQYDGNASKSFLPEQRSECFQVYYSILHCSTIYDLASVVKALTGLGLLILGEVKNQHSGGKEAQISIYIFWRFCPKYVIHYRQLYACNARNLCRHVYIQLCLAPYITDVLQKVLRKMNYSLSYSVVCLRKIVYQSCLQLWSHFIQLRYSSKYIAQG